MFGQAHAGLGWLVGVATPGADRRLRVWCVVAAVLPDIDAIPFLFGKELYDRWHHTFGHNVFLGILTILAAAWHLRLRPPKRRFFETSLVGLCWASHILTDMKLSGWEVYLLWPFSRQGYEFFPMLSLGHPINFVLVYALMGAVVPLALWRGVTPLEILSPRLDRIVTNFFRRKELACVACARRCNNRCDGCDGPVCMSHGRLRWFDRIACPTCVEKVIP